MDTEQISSDSAVCVEDSAGNKEWYIIDDRKDADIHRREIHFNHPLAKKLLGKSVDDEVILKESHITQEVGKIVELKSKYVYALHESCSMFETVFPDASGLIEVTMQSSEDEPLTESDFQPILDEVSRQHENTLKAEELYKEGKITLGAFANILNKDVLHDFRLNRFLLAFK